MQVLPDGMVVLAEPNPDSLLAALEEAIHLAHTVDPLLQHQQVNVSIVYMLLHCHLGHYVGLKHCCETWAAC